MTNKFNYPTQIRIAVKLLVDELAKSYPHIMNYNFDSMGLIVGSGGSSFQDRMEMGVYMELIKAGVSFEMEQ